jgi:hypothetical protein
MTRASFQGKTSENDLASMNEMLWSVERTAHGALVNVQSTHVDRGGCFSVPSWSPAALLRQFPSSP